MENKAVVLNDGEVRQMFQVEQIVYLLASIIEIILLLRFLFVFFNANQSVRFVEALYDLASVFVSPFLYIFPSTIIGGYTIEWSSLIAILVYAFLSAIFVKILRVIFYRQFSHSSP
jgi:uncharacterized protein YggT (Ycf19 family)